MSGFPSSAGINPPAGDIGGTAAAPTVVKLQGTTLTAPDGNSAHFLNGTGGWTAASGALSVISQQVLGSAVATVTFSSIPGTYENLILVIVGAFTGGSSDVELQFNGDTGAHYDWQLLNGNNTATSASASVAQTSILLGQLNQAGTPAAQANSMRIVIPGYADTNFNKTVLAENMRITGTTAAALVRTSSGGNWRSAAAITSIVVLNDGATTFVANSRFTLYGELG